MQYAKKISILKNHLLPFQLLINVILICPVTAQQITFNRITSPEATYFGLINDVTQDPEGYMWFATWGRGLHRYDGYHFINYRNDPLNPGSLSENDLQSVCADSNGIIWIGTGKLGLDRLDTKTGIFTNFRHEKQNPKSISDDRVTVLLSDHEGTVWIGTENGLNKLDQKTKTFTRYFYSSNDSTSLTSNLIQVLYEDRRHKLWVGTRSGKNTAHGTGGLNRFDQKTGKFKRYPNNLTNSHNLINKNIGAIFEDSKGNFWISSAGGGLYLMDRDNGMFEQLRYDQPNPSELIKLSGQKKMINTDLNLYFICEDGTGAIWMRGSGEWITRFDPGTKKVTHFNSINGDAQAAQAVSGGYMSRDGVLWITTWSGNIYRVDPFHHNIGHHSTGSIVHAIHQDRSGVLWVGTFRGEGVLRIDRTKRSTKKYLNESPPDRFFDSWITAFYEGMDDTMWIGTGNGLHLFDRKKQTSITLYRNNPKDEKSLSKGFITAIIENKAGSLWIATTGGLDQLDIRTGVFSHFPNNSKDRDNRINNEFTALLKDHSGNLWLGTMNGNLHRFDPRSKIFKHFRCGLNMGSIVEDHENNIWVGTSTGLYRSNEAVDSFSRFTDPEIGLTATTIVAGILEDDQKNLWVSSSEGIFRFDDKRNEIRVFKMNQGVDASGLSFYLMRGEKGRDGELFFGHRTGYYTFFPDQLKGNLLAPQIIISNFSLADQPVKPSKVGPLDKPITQTTEINLNYNQNVFSFDFTGIHYSSPEDNQHLYMLENLDNSWRKASPEKKAFYYHVPPGKYFFRVKVSNSYGVWAEKAIKIIISPPWWSNLWIQIAAVLCLAALFYALIRRRLHQKFRLQLDRSEKEKQLANLQHKTAELEMQALRAQMNPHFIFNSLNSINMFILENNKLQASEYLSKFSRLVRLILQSSQEALIPLDKELDALQLYLQLESLRFDNRFEYKISVDKEVNRTALKVPPLIIQPYVENAVWHGLMHKKEQGHLDIDLYQQNEILCCKITDNGIGRKRAEELKSKSSITYKSMGMRITADRLALLHQKEQDNSYVSIVDLVLPDGSPGGTEVLIKLPLFYG